MAAKIAKKKAHRPVGVLLLLAYNTTVIAVEGVCCQTGDCNENEDDSREGFDGGYCEGERSPARRGGGMYGNL